MKRKHVLLDNESLSNLERFEFPKNVSKAHVVLATEAPSGDYGNDYIRVAIDELSEPDGFVVQTVELLQIGYDSLGSPENVVVDIELPADDYVLDVDTVAHNYWDPALTLYVVFSD